MKLKTQPSFFLYLFFTGLPFLNLNADTLYVDASATGANNGTSWQDAFTTLGSALLSADYGDDIWVATGTYFPTSSDNRFATFFIFNGIKLYGGFNGGETSIDQRDWQINPTILSGDIGISGDSTDNSYTVVYMDGVDSTTILDGFVIEKGVANDVNASGDNPRRNGGGIYLIGDDNVSESHPTIRNCIIQHNFALTNGGGVYVKSESGGRCSFEVGNCDISNNSSSQGGGVAIMNAGIEFNSSFKNCKFSSNVANEGGGVYFSIGGGNKDLFFEECHFIQNFSLISGNGLYVENQINSPGKVYCNISSFTHNIGGPNSSGGAIAIIDLTISNLAFIQLDRCIFNNNSANSGGTISLFESTLDAKNSLFLNSTANQGGLLEGEGFLIDSECYFNHCTFYNFQNGSSSFAFRGNYFLHNCIVIEKYPDNLPPKPIISQGNVTISHSLVDVANCNGIQSSANCGPGMIFDQDPLFVNPDSGDFRLLPCSPARDAGSVAFLTDQDTLDFDGMPRIAADSVDMGAFELPAFQAFLDPSQNVLCKGDSSGQITGSIQSACLPLTLGINDTSIVLDSAYFSLPDLPAGTYDLTFSDAQNYQDSLQIQIEEPPSALALEVSTFPVDCQEGLPGSAITQAINGPPPFSYQWSGSFPGTADQDSLPAGDYVLSVTDSLGCTVIDSFSIPTMGMLALQAQIDSISCFDGFDGALTVIPQNNAAPFTWQWADGQNGASIDSLGAGTFTVTVIDANNCTDSLTLQLEAPDSLTLALLAPPIVCFEAEDATLAGVPGGGTPPYNYEWSQGQIDSLISGQPAGDYQLTLTDDNGCTQVEVTSVQEAAPIELIDTLTTHASGETTQDGAITIGSISGGISPYSYHWSTNDSTLSIQNLLPGLYFLEVTDSLGCVVEFVFEVGFVVGITSMDHQFGEVRVIPNPFDEQLEFNFQFSTAKEGQIRIYDFLGRQVDDWEGMILPGQGVFFENTINWGEGIFLWEVKIDDEIQTGKIIKK